MMPCQDSEDDDAEVGDEAEEASPTDLSDITMGEAEVDINGNWQVPPPISRRARDREIRQGAEAASAKVGRLFS